MKEHERVRLWMAKYGIDVAELAQLTGYSTQALYWMIRGLAPPNRTRKKPGSIQPWIWQRFKRCCQGVDAELRTKKEFNW